MSAFQRKPPAWFWIVSVVLFLWAAAGVFALYAHATLSGEGLAQMSAYDRESYLKLPVWFVWVFALATLPALIGAAALLMRSAIARPLYFLSLVGVVVQFGWVFGATDLIAVKGASATVPFPVAIFALGVFAWWFAGMAKVRGWLR